MDQLQHQQQRTVARRVATRLPLSMAAALARKSSGRRRLARCLGDSGGVLVPLGRGECKEEAAREPHPLLEWTFNVFKTLADLVQELTVEKEEDDPVDATTGADAEAVPTRRSKKPRPFPTLSVYSYARPLSGFLTVEGEEALDEHDLYDYEKGSPRPSSSWTRMAGLC